MDSNQNMPEDDSFEDGINGKSIPIPVVEDQQSVRSAESQLFSQRQSLVGIIASKRQPSEIKISKMLGFGAFLTIITITTVLFIENKQNFDNQWVNYSNLVIGPKLTETFSQVLRMKEILTIIGLNSQFGYLNSQFSSSLRKEFFNEAVSKLAGVSTIIGEL